MFTRRLLLFRRLIIYAGRARLRLFSYAFRRYALIRFDYCFSCFFAAFSFLPVTPMPLMRRAARTYDDIILFTRLIALEAQRRLLYASCAVIIVVCARARSAARLRRMRDAIRLMHITLLLHFSLYTPHTPGR